MREIKFRAFKKSTKTILPVNSLKAICTNSERLIEKEYDDLIIQQSTGLFDKNGKEIFEGDVIVTTVRHQSVPKGTTMVIVWDDTELCFIAQYIQYLNQKWYYPLRVTSNKKFKIIGNIYENPKLLTN